jgi:hypothetical protein
MSINRFHLIGLLEKCLCIPFSSVVLNSWQKHLALPTTFSSLALSLRRLTGVCFLGQGVSATLAVKKQSGTGGNS